MMVFLNGNQRYDSNDTVQHTNPMGNQELEGYRMRVTLGPGRKTVPEPQEPGLSSCSLGLSSCSPVCVHPWTIGNSCIFKYTPHFYLNLEVKHVQSKFGLCPRTGSQIIDTG